jgi:hypothetical protein
MSKAKRERIILGLLLAVLAFAGWNLWRSMNPVQAVPATVGESPVAQPVDTDPFAALEISSDWSETIPPEEGGAERNPFQYGMTTPPPRPPAAQAPPPQATFVRPPPPVQAPSPPPPPPLPLQYVGFSRIGGPAAELRAVLMGTDGLPYPAVAGDTLMGQYRVQEVTEGFVVVEDLQSGRRERLQVSLQD